MAAEVTNLIGEMKFYEEELVDVGEQEVDLMGNMEGTKRWVDRKQNSVAGSETRAEERIVGPGKEVTIVDKGKATTSTGSRYRSPKRTLQGKIRFST
ncbi:hypothetical protein V6N12_069447 [Hibiscus sabdariffa]|uniref:Uncharacterized protein n=1 Tax=Hibiscus sabdariffa TaxID=183260 RepID=A0ABR2FDY0_9ROSI